ncbi:UNVERIFIED_CONTAM: hypothetical protein HDU68_006866 [Siphonaria sp. JEL0065]|nr:hypothetical protein HDU68_006866 [Siphonaria sp. JEL0065]
MSFPEVPPIEIDEATRDQVLQRLATKIRKFYCEPDKAELIATDLESRTTKNEFVKGSTLQELKNLLNPILKASDLHFGIHILPADEAIMEEPQDTGEFEEPSSEDTARYTEQVALKNFGIPKAEILQGNVGYFKWDNQHNCKISSQRVIDTLNYLSDSNALIVDLRECGGGDPDTADVLYDVLFEGEIHVNDFYWRPTNETKARIVGKRDRFPTLKRKWFDKPVYILVSNVTFSCGEEIAYTLQTFGRAKIIGSNTGGGAHPGMTVWLHPQAIAFISTGININTLTKTDWEPNGVIPDYSYDPEMALLVAHKLALEYVVDKFAEKTAQHFKTFVESSKTKIEALTNEIEKFSPKSEAPASNATWIKTITTTKKITKKNGREVVETTTRTSYDQKI